MSGLLLRKENGKEKRIAPKRREQSQRQNLGEKMARMRSQNKNGEKNWTMPRHEQGSRKKSNANTKPGKPKISREPCKQRLKEQAWHLRPARRRPCRQRQEKPTQREESFQYVCPACHQSSDEQHTHRPSKSSPDMWEPFPSQRRMRRYEGVCVHLPRVQWASGK